MSEPMATTIHGFMRLAEFSLLAGARIANVSLIAGSRNVRLYVCELENVDLTEFNGELIGCWLKDCVLPVPGRAAFCGIYDRGSTYVKSGAA